MNRIDSELRRELYADAALDRIRDQAPARCRNCDHLAIGAYDGRFNHEFGTSGEITYYPKCMMTGEEPDDDLCRAKAIEEIKSILKDIEIFEDAIRLCRKRMARHIKMLEVA